MPRVIITVPEKTPQPYRFQLDRYSVTLGRDADNDIVIDSGSVSVKHAQMLRVSGGYLLRDMNSTNGIKLDDQSSAEIPLYNGMSLKLGDVTFDFTLTQEEQVALTEERVHDGPPVSWQPEKSTSRLPPLRDDPTRALAMLEEPSEPTDGGGSVIPLVILLALAVFGIGMAIRFQKDTGGPLIDAIKAKIQTPAKAPTLHP